MAMLDENVLWNAVLERAAGWDGVFVYGVTSTRIYCRPTCPSRRPRRDRARFFAHGDLARAEGFRPCRRCRPQEASTSTPALDRIRGVAHAIAARKGARVSLAALARASGIGQHQLLRSFKRALGITPREYADACRTGCLKSALKSGRGIADAGYAAGYGSGSRVYERAPSTLGMTPARYAAGGKGESVRYAIARSSIGHVLVASTDRGICAVTLGDSAEALSRDLAVEFPGAHVERDEAALAPAVSAVVDSIEKRAPDPRLPLDVRATAFQQRVWKELQRIPRGRTRTYREIAERIGRPAAARAVARACASNPVALVVPCHRVVRADGSTSGYRWGSDRKKRLLEGEAGD